MLVLSVVLAATFAGRVSAQSASDSTSESAPPPAPAPATAAPPESPPATPLPPAESVPAQAATGSGALPELAPFSDVALPRGLSPGDAGYSPGEATDATTEQLDEIYARHRGMFTIPFVDGAVNDVVRGLNSFYEKTGFRFGVAYTTIFQQASGGYNGFSGDLDLMTSWDLLGRGTPNTGTLVFTGEDRFRQADQPASALQGDLGTLQPTTNSFNARGWVVRDAFWLQRFFDNRLRVLIGRADLTDYVGAHRLQNVNNSFANRFFSANASIAAPGHGPTAGVSFVPCDWFYVNAGIANAYGTTSTIGLSSLDQGDFFYTAEFGLTPEIAGLGAGRYQVTLWQMDAREERNLPRDRGISFILNQDIGEHLLAFARYSYSDATLTNIQNAVQAGLGYRGLLGSPDNLTGFAGSWAQPPSGGGRNETVFELFHRFQLTQHSQLTIGGQLILDPANSPNDSDAVGVLTARFRFAF